MFIRRTVPAASASTSPSASCAPSASARRCDNAPCSTWDDTSMSRKATGRRCAGASTNSSPVSYHCHPMAPRRSNHTPNASPRCCSPVSASAPHPRQRARGTTFQHVDVDSLELIRPRSVGVEHAGLWAMDQLGLRTRLEALGIGASVRTAAIGSIIARMARPGSERATRRWLGERSALGELLGVDFETMGPMRLYRASDALMAHPRSHRTPPSSTGRWTCSTSTPPSPSTT